MTGLWSLITGHWRSDEAETERLIRSLENGNIEDAGKVGRRLGHHGRAPSILRAALASFERKHWELALDLAERGIMRFPANADLNYVCGRVWHFRGAWERALEYYARATDLKGDHAKAWIDTGCVLHALGRIAQAREAFLRAVALESCIADAHNNLGALAAEAGELDDACRHFELACASDPSFFSAHYNLGRALKETDRIEEGDVALRRATALKPHSAVEALRALSTPVVLDDARQAHAIRSSMDEWLQHEHAVDIENVADEMELSWFSLAYHGIDDTARYRRIAEFFAASCPDLAFEAPHCRRRSAPGGRLKVGFISHYLHYHSIGRTTHGVIPRLSRDQFEVYALFLAPVVDDALSREIRAQADFAVVVPHSLQQAREVVAALELDILFYQDIGLDTLTYFLAFSRLAPTQCVGWGHPVTCGIPAIDFFISTEGFEPPGGEKHYNERLLKMANVPTPSIYTRPDSALATLSRSAAGFDDSANVYFCPQTFYKLHPDFDAALAAILRADRKAVVYLLQHKHRSFEERLKARFARGLPDVADRIRFLPRVQDIAHYYSRLRHAHVLLDSFHFGGGNTSLEGFALGTPIVTLPGAFMRGRHTLSMYHAMEITDCIADSVAHYVELAVRLGIDPGFRRDVASRLEARSPVLYEDERVARELEKAFVEAARASRP
jgi:predicted O-linked N-acetylglucosamine transferase (SPINDLY family)